MTMPKVDGLNHVAYVTYDPMATIKFYRDILGFRFSHAISVKAWGDTPYDFVHIFFDIGRGGTIAFFYYFGLEKEGRVPTKVPKVANHLAIEVESEEELENWRQKLSEKGIKVSEAVDHEFIKSIYFRDPNGILLELTVPTQQLGEAEQHDVETFSKAFEKMVGEGSNCLERLLELKGEIAKEELALVK